MQITRQAVEQAAAESNLSVLEALRCMQMVAAKAGDERLLNTLCAIKSEILGM